MISMESTVEQFWVKELSNGSEAAFNALYKKYCDRIFNYSFLFLKDHNGAEEVVQHVFVKIWEKRATLNPDLSFQGYLFRITKNCVLKLLNKSLRKNTRIVKLSNNCENMMGDGGSEIIYSELKEETRREIANLSGQRKLVFVMSRKLNLTNREIAEKLGISTHTVKRHKNLAMKSLNQALANA